jgi:hypothetical protein
VNATGNVLLCVLGKNGFKTGVTVVLIILTARLCSRY